MASFTDTRPPVLSPYVPGLPVDQLYKAAMYKQQLYDQHFAALQEAGNKIAGIDILPNYKNYLNQKLTDLNASIRKNLVGADLSDMRTYLNAMQMINNIANDDVIRQGLANTAFVRQQEQLIQDDQKKNGNNAAPNIFDFYRKLSKWMQSGDLKSSFNYNYTGYTDWQKEMNSILQRILPHYDQAEQYFKTDENGKVILNPKTGLPEINPVVIEKQGITADKIYSALANGLTEGTKKQIQLEGRYALRNILDDTDAIKKVITGGIDNEIEEYNNFIDNLQKEKNSLVAKNAKEYKEKLEQLDNSIKSFQNIVASLSAKRNNILSQIERDPEEALGNYYLEDKLSSIAKSYAYERESAKINPYFQADLESKNYLLRLGEFELAKARFKLQQEEFEIEKAYKLMQIEKMKRELENTDTANSPYSSVITPGTDVGQPKGVDLKDQLEKKVEYFKNLDSNFLKDLSAYKQTLKELGFVNPDGTVNLPKLVNWASQNRDKDLTKSVSNLSNPEKAQALLDATLDYMRDKTIANKLSEEAEKQIPQKDLNKPVSFYDGTSIPYSRIRSWKNGLESNYYYKNPDALGNNISLYVNYDDSGKPYVVVKGDKKTVVIPIESKNKADAYAVYGLFYEKLKNSQKNVSDDYQFYPPNVGDVLNVKGYPLGENFETALDNYYKNAAGFKSFNDYMVNALLKTSTSNDYLNYNLNVNFKDDKSQLAKSMKSELLNYLLNLSSAQHIANKEKLKTLIPEGEEAVVEDFSDVKKSELPNEINSLLADQRLSNVNLISSGDGKVMLLGLHFTSAVDLSKGSIQQQFGLGGTKARAIYIPIYSQFLTSSPTFMNFISRVQKNMNLRNTISTMEAINPDNNTTNPAYDPAKNLPIKELFERSVFLPVNKLAPGLSRYTVRADFQNVDGAYRTLLFVKDNETGKYYQTDLGKLAKYATEGQSISSFAKEVIPENQFDLSSIESLLSTLNDQIIGEALKYSISK